MQDIKKYLPRPLRYLLKYIEEKRLHQLQISKKTIFDLYAFNKWMTTTPKLDSTWFDIVELFIKTFGLCVVNNFSYGLSRLLRKPQKIELVKNQLWHLLGLVESMIKKVDNHCNFRDFQLKNLDALKKQSKFQYNVFKKLQKMEILIDDKHLFLYMFMMNSRRWAGKCIAKLRIGDFERQRFKAEEEELVKLQASQKLIEQTIFPSLNDLDKRFFCQLVRFYARVKFQFLDFDVKKSSLGEVNQDEIIEQYSSQNDSSENSYANKQTNDLELEPGEVRQEQNLNEENQDTSLKSMKDDSETKSEHKQFEEESEETEDLEQGELSPPCDIFHSQKEKNNLTKINTLVDQYKTGPKNTKYEIFPHGKTTKPSNSSTRASKLQLKTLSNQIKNSSRQTNTNSKSFNTATINDQTPQIQTESQSLKNRPTIEQDRPSNKPNRQSQREIKGLNTRNKNDSTHQFTLNNTLNNQSTLSDPLFLKKGPDQNILSKKEKITPTKNLERLITLKEKVNKSKQIQFATITKKVLENTQSNEQMVKGEDLGQEQQIIEMQRKLEQFQKLLRAKKLKREQQKAQFGIENAQYGLQKARIQIGTVGSSVQVQNMPQKKEQMEN